MHSAPMRIPVNVRAEFEDEGKRDALRAYAELQLRIALSELMVPLSAVEIVLRERPFGVVKRLRCEASITFKDNQRSVYVSHAEPNGRVAIRTAARLALWHSARAVHRTGVRQTPLIVNHPLMEAVS
ncbi:MAG: hypothetical protein ACE366_19880 [Bradymonadia bacterium]